MPDYTARLDGDEFDRKLHPWPHPRWVVRRVVMYTLFMVFLAYINLAGITLALHLLSGGTL